MEVISPPKKTWNLFKDRSLFSSARPIKMTPALRERLQVYKETRDYAFLLAEEEEPAPVHVAAGKDKQKGKSSPNYTVLDSAPAQAPDPCPAAGVKQAVVLSAMQQPKSSPIPSTAAAATSETSTPAPVRTYKLFKDKAPIEVTEELYKWTRVSRNNTTLFNSGSAASTTSQAHRERKVDSPTETKMTQHPKVYAVARVHMGSIKSSKPGTRTKVDTLIKSSTAAEKPTYTSQADRKRKLVDAPTLETKAQKKLMSKVYAAAGHGHTGSKASIKSSKLETRTNPPTTIGGSSLGRSYDGSQLCSMSSISEELRDEFQRMMSRTTEARREQAARLASKIRGTYTPALKAY